MDVSPNAISHTLPSDLTDVPHIAHIVQALWERTAERLTAADLAWFAGASDTADQAIQNLENLITGLASYISVDVPNDHKSANMGRFENGEDVSNLLFFLGESTCHIRSLMFIGRAATDRLSNAKRLSSL